jgi:hypothetical protein
MYIDTGYFGNLTTKKWHRIAKNNLQTLDHKSLDRVYDIVKYAKSDGRIVHLKNLAVILWKDLNKF